MLAALIVIAPIVFAQGYNYTGSYEVYHNVNGIIGISIAVAAILLAALYFILRFKHFTIRIIVLGIALAPIGILIWLYGDYGGGSSYVWAGVLILIIGTIIWTAGDVLGGAFDQRVAKLMEMKKTGRKSQ